MKKFNNLSCVDVIYAVNPETLEISELKISSVTHKEISLSSGYYNRIDVVDDVETFYTNYKYSNDNTAKIKKVFVNKQDAENHLKNICLGKINKVRDEIYLKLEEVKKIRLQHFDVLSGFDVVIIKEDIEKVI